MKARRKRKPNSELKNALNQEANVKARCGAEGQQKHEICCANRLVIGESGTEREREREREREMQLFKTAITEMKERIG